LKNTEVYTAEESEPLTQQRWTIFIFFIGLVSKSTSKMAEDGASKATRSFHVSWRLIVKP